MTVDGAVIGKIGSGLLVFLGVEKGDTPSQVDRMLERVLTYRVFCDAQGRMNTSLLDTKQDLLVVSQFTLAADTRKGTRPSFSSAAAPDVARGLYEQFVSGASKRVQNVATGRYGADMKVALVNDGPVTFWLQVSSGA